jgi:hypothetical protein
MSEQNFFSSSAAFIQEIPQAGAIPLIRCEFFFAVCLIRGAAIVTGLP